MPVLPHLPLQRVVPERQRRKTGFGRPPSRNHVQHGTYLSSTLDYVIQEFRSRQPFAGVNPNLILRIKLNASSSVDEDTWGRCGLTLLSADQDKTLVLFSSDMDLTDFKRRLNDYTSGPPVGQQSAPHCQIFACIDEIGKVRPEDRIGRLLRQSNINSPMDFAQNSKFTLDVELWDLGTRILRQSKLEEVVKFVRSKGGRVTDTYLGESLILLRIQCNGSLVSEMLAIDAVALVDLPPTPSLAVLQAINLGIKNFPAVPPPEDGAPIIAVIDSGVMPGHPLLGPAISEATVIPASLGDAVDRNGHGTMVSGIAVYGDVSDCISANSFAPPVRLLSARVLNDRCQFDDDLLITSQMRKTIEYFKEIYRCRVFNLSLGDPRQPYSGGKVSPWAAVLDALARDFDSVIVVSSGNYRYNPPAGTSPDSFIQDYPRYLWEDPARVIEPATGAVVLTVGAIAGSANVPSWTAERSVGFRPIAQPGQPSPFTRSGQGIGGAVKPELCDYGGNFVYNGDLRQILDNVRECSVISLNYDYLNRLFSTDNGTSYAAPRVAHLAARLFGLFPDASANLIRALLASSASVPQATTDLLSNFGKDKVLRLCGYGRPNFDRAKASEENRVLMFADTSIAFDNFHVYEVPIPTEFLTTNGKRNISVTLAFDPPVRHSRFDYLGAKMSFRLIRGKSVDQIVDAFRQRTRDEGRLDSLTSTSFNCLLVPGPHIREAGTLQKATFSMTRNPDERYGETYYLVVRCERKWAGDEYGPQRYAVVVEEEHTQEVNLFNTISNRVQARIQMR